MTQLKPQDQTTTRATHRRLPHICPKGVPIFVTWRLTGALPPHVALDIKKVDGLTPGQRFARNDSYLDGRTRGPMRLKDERIAEEVCSSLERGAYTNPKQYDLHEYVVMPNHVHALFTPVAEMSVIMRNLKGYTAHFANELLGFHGKAFWQKDYYDHFCRDDREFQNIRRYIAMNPVKARLAARPEDWKWSSAARIPRPEAARRALLVREVGVCSKVATAGA